MMPPTMAAHSGKLLKGVAPRGQPESIHRFTSAATAESISLR